MLVGPHSVTGSEVTDVRWTQHIPLNEHIKVQCVVIGNKSLFRGTLECITAHSKCSSLSLGTALKWL